MSSVASRLIRRAAAFGESGGAATVDWVTLTSVVVVAGIVTVYFMLGDDGGFFGMVDAMNAEVNQSSENISGVAIEGEKAFPGGGEGGEDQQAGGG